MQPSPPEQLKLVARLCEQLSAGPLAPIAESEAEQLRRERRQLAEELLAACEDIEDDSQREFDAAGDICRREVSAQLSLRCQPTEPLRAAARIFCTRC